MTNKDLKRRNRYLLLQLRLIHELVKDAPTDTDELWKMIGRIQYHSAPETVKNNIKFIEENDKEYNFYEKDKDISKYE